MSTLVRMTKTAQRHAAQADASQRQADLYRKMAEQLRRLDPTYQDCVVNDEVARMIRQADEFDQDAEYEREQALLNGYEPE